MKSPSIKDGRPDRKHLGPTGPTRITKDSKRSYQDKHPNPGTAGQDKPGVPPVRSPRGKSSG